MTTVAIMQPTYLPWLGYFDMLDQADVFVLLDTVAVSPKSWQTRNRIRERGGKVVWLSVPTNAKRGKPLNEVMIDHSQPWWGSHMVRLKSAYFHCDCWPNLWSAFTSTGVWEHKARLADFTFCAIYKIAQHLGINTPIARASDLDFVTDDPYQRIADICASVGASELLNTPGAKDWLDGHDVGVPVRWHEYEHPTYSQGNAPFVSHLSVVDLLAWHGPDSLGIIRSGRR